jgi:hypothetical protein
MSRTSCGGLRTLAEMSREVLERRISELYWERPREVLPAARVCADVYHVVGCIEPSWFLETLLERIVFTAEELVQLEAEAAEGGSASSAFLLGYCYLEREFMQRIGRRGGLHKDNDLAWTYLSRAARAGHVLANASPAR